MMVKNNIIKQISKGIKQMCDIWANEMRGVFKDEGMLIFFILVPLFYPLLYSWMYNNETVRDVPVAVIDNSRSSLSRDFIDKYDATPDVKVIYHCANLAEAKALIGRHIIDGIVYIPEDLQRNIKQDRQSTVSVYCDMSIMLYYKAIYQAATAVAQDLNSGIQIARAGNFTNRDDQLTIIPLAVSGIAVFNSDGGYADFIIPGVLILILHQTLLLGIGLSAGTVRDRKASRLFSIKTIPHLINATAPLRVKRNNSATAEHCSETPELLRLTRNGEEQFLQNKHLLQTQNVKNNWLSILLGKTMCYFMIYAVMAAYITLVVPRFFGFVQMAQAQALTALIIPFLLATIFFGMALSTLIRHREDVMLIVVFTSVPFLFLSGISWPQADMPGFWQGVACLFPSTFGIRGFVRINVMGANLTDISTEYIALWVQALAYLLLTCCINLYHTKRQSP